MGRRRYFRTLIPALLATVVVLGCRRSPPPGPPVAVLFADLAGCKAVRRAAPGDALVCELPKSRRLRIFVKEPVHLAPAAPARMISDVPSELGRLVSVEVDEGAPAIAFRSNDGARAVTIAIASAPSFPRVEDARTKRQEGDLSAAVAIAEDAAKSADPVEAALAEGTLARALLARGSIEPAVAHFRIAIERHRALSRLSDAADDTFACAFAMNQRSHRFAEARDLLAHVDVSELAEGRARLAYYRGVLESETGDHRLALADLDRAVRLAGSLGMDRLVRSAKGALALEWIKIGRAEEAISVARDVVLLVAADPEAPPCERVEAAINLGYAATSRDAGAEARAAFDSALAVAACKDPTLRAIALGDRAELALVAGQPKAARASLEEARLAVSEPKLGERLFWLDLDARIALAEGALESATTIFERERRIAEAAGLEEDQWRSEAGLGAALLRRGRASEAVGLLEAAESRLSRLSRAVPLGEGRGAYLSERDESARLLVSALLALDRDEDAFNAARRARVRITGSLVARVRSGALEGEDRAKMDRAIERYWKARDARIAEAEGAWSLSKETLAARRGSALPSAASLLEAELVLIPEPRLAAIDAHALTVLVFPLTEGSVVFSAFEGRTRAERVSASPTGELLISRLDRELSQLGEGEEIRVLAYGDSRQIDLHAAPTRNGLLGERFSVVYPLDLAPAERGPGPTELTLVVGDPSSDLPRARAEATSLERTLREQNRGVRALYGKEATHAAILRGLAEASSLHYAGHASSRGEEGFGSALVLAGKTELEVTDLLALAVVPDRVTLVACEAGAVDRRARAEVFGVAQAFVLAGASTVFAPTRRVSDDDGGIYGAALAAAKPDRASLRAAYRALRTKKPEGDWAAFRLFVP